MGGDPEGYSIPAQREACQRKAASLGAVLVEEFVDRGESARSANRPELQRMLAYVRAGQIDYVIVHKVDRLARSRSDDVTINLALQAAGVTLVSVTENIDETPSGLLLHGIMSSIAEFYSRNLANEVIKGSVQKAKNGGTPGLAPIGYRNVRTLDNGREIRTIELDPERGPLIAWAFEEYARGEWTIRKLLNELTSRGLTCVAGPRRPVKPISAATMHRTLRNPYYKGLVTYQGVEYPGRHQPLVTPELWQRVQDVLEAQNYAGEKTRDHPHYLKGTVFCGRCGSRLIVCNSKNRWGTIYPYFICLGRQRDKSSCRQKAMLITKIEDLVANEYLARVLKPDEIADLQAQLANDLKALRDNAVSEREHANRSVRRLTDERDKLLQAHYAGAIPLDQLKSEQVRISRGLEAAESRLKITVESWEQVDSFLARCMTLITMWDTAYAQASAKIRRLMNQAIFTSIWVDDDGTVTAGVAEPLASLLEAAGDLEPASASSESSERPVWQSETFWSPDV
ncbi:MAG: recombinase family protein, partial [Actinomycetota bacterium]|nr:recombinase family protein [Actinomycetota bacterium]